MDALASSRAKRVIPLLFALFCAQSAAAEPPRVEAAGSGQQDATSTKPGGAAREAEGHFKRARQLFDEGDYSLALIEFQRAYDVVPNHRVLYNIGQVEIQLSHYSAARLALQRFLDDGGAEIPPGRKKQAEEDLRMLAERTAFLHVVTTPAADVSIDDQPAIAAPFAAPILVNAGQRKVVATREGYMSATRLVTLTGGDRKELTLELIPVPTATAAPLPVTVNPGPVVLPTRPNYTPAIVGWIATGAFAVSAAVVGGIYLGKQADVESLNDPARNVSRKLADDTSSSAESLALTADLLGVAALGTALVSLYFTFRPPHVEATPSAAVLRIRPMPTGIAGTF